MSATKLAAALYLLSSRLTNPDSVPALLYLADRMHLAEHGQTITGLRYRRTARSIGVLAPAPLDAMTPLPFLNVLSPCEVVTLTTVNRLGLLLDSTSIGLLAFDGAAASTPLGEEIPLSRIALYCPPDGELRA